MDIAQNQFPVLGLDVLKQFDFSKSKHRKNFMYELLTSWNRTLALKVLRHW